MTILLSAAAVAGLLAGPVHGVWLRRRLNAARRDPLTGLHTRDTFTRHAVRALRSGPALVVLADINDFKQTNDTHGHAAGDAVLTAVASRLALFTRSAPAGRLGGDEFGAVLPLPPAWARLRLEKLHTALCQPVEFDGLALDVSVSLGGAIVTAGRRSGTGALLSYALRRADEAMYTAKRSHGRTHLVDLSAEDLPGLTASVNGRRAGRPGTHQPNGGTR